jgi:hypothetical protein
LQAVQHCQCSSEQQLQLPKTGDTVTLSNYPNAGILISVVMIFTELLFIEMIFTDFVVQPTQSGSSACIESILFPPHLVPLEVFWAAPVQCSTVQITIVISQEAEIQRFCLLVDALGYVIIIFALHQLFFQLWT